MMCRSFVRRCDPEQHRFTKRHGKEIDSHGKLCRHRADQATVPAKLEDEHVTNPFLRCDDPRIAAALKLVDATPVEVFAALRKLRDKFQNMPH